jgi:hypothetical protein
MTFPHNDNDDFDFGVDLSTVEDAQDYSPIPPGKYAVVATAIEMKDSKSGGKYVKATFDLTEQYAGRKIFENFNLVNANATTVEIAQRQVKQFLAAAGIDPNQPLKLSVIREGIGVEVLATVSVDPGKGDYGPSNRIKRYDYIEQAAPAPVQQRAAPAPRPTQQVPPQVAPRTGGAQPWKK